MPREAVCGAPYHDAVSAATGARRARLLFSPPARYNRHARRHCGASVSENPESPKVMRSVGRLLRKFGPWLIAGILLLSVPLAFRAARLTMETDISRFFAEDDPIIRQFRFFSENFGVTDALVLVARRPGKELAPKLEALEHWLHATGYFSRVTRADMPGHTKIHVILAFANQPCTDLVFNRRMVGDVRAYLEEKGLPVELAGAPAEAIEANAALQRDVRRTGLVAAVLILAVMVFALGDVAAPVLAAMPLTVAIMWLMAIAQIWFGRVNLMSACLPTSLLGIGIDYALHLHAGRGAVSDPLPERAWAEVFRRIGPPLLVGATTTAAAFFALAFAQLRGFNQMGILGGLGLGLIFVLSMAAMPTLLDWGRTLGLRFRPLSFQWLVDLADWSTRHRPVTIAAFLLVTVALSIAAAGMRFEHDPKAYENPSLKTTRLRAKLSRELEMCFQPVLIATGSLRDERAVLAHVRAYVGAGKEFRHVDCLSDDLNRPGFRARLDFFSSRDGKKLCMMLYPRGNPYVGRRLKQVNDAANDIVARSDGKVLAVAGGPVLVQRALAVTRRDMMRTGLVASLAVLGILALLVRRPRYYLATLVPLVGGVIWMLGIIRLAGYKFSLANAMTMPLVLGLGIDYGVHIVYRLRRSTVHQVMASTGRAIVVSAVTTAAAFFSLCTAQNGGLVAMGAAAGTGILSCLAWSVIFLPALLGQGQEQRLRPRC